jgi:hypothetical protein
LDALFMTDLAILEIIHIRIAFLITATLWTTWL